MISINTNTSSQIAQSCFANSTKSLNKAIERMTTGFKINKSSDNAANYSISNHIDTKISAYNMASDNVAAGLDLVATASSTLDLMNTSASRLRAICIQAKNGTYGASSLSALNSEAEALVANILSLYHSANYNGISLLDKTSAIIESKSLPTANSNGFIDDTAITEPPTPQYNGFIDDSVTYTDEEIITAENAGTMKKLSSISTSTAISSGKYTVHDSSDLAKLATMVNSGKITGGEFILAEDIDLSGINWTPIGTSSKQFAGKFDGNGHVVKNLTIDAPSLDYQGLFGRTTSSSVLKNIGIENCDIKGKGSVGGLVGYAQSSITNSYVTGNVSGTSNVGGLAGYAASITNSYTTGNVSGTSNVGGLAGYAQSSITNSYAIGNVTGTSNCGGLAGTAYTITNSYATGIVTGTSYVGGLAGYAQNSITNSYAIGNVTGTSNCGGLAGFAYDFINSYATGNVTGASNCGGLAGTAYTITNSYATGNVTGTNHVGGLVGGANTSITNSYATGNVTGTYQIGGLAGYYSGTKIDSCYAAGNVVSTNTDSKYLSSAGGLVGQIYKISGTCNIKNSVSFSNSVTGNFEESIGSLVGGIVDTTNSSSFATITITDCDANNVSGLNMIGGEYQYDGSTSTKIENEERISRWLENINGINLSTTLQVGIYGTESSTITFNTGLFSENVKQLNCITTFGIGSDNSYSIIDSFLSTVTSKATELGAVSNRLESVVDLIDTNIINYTSSLSTIRDTDIAKVSSQYIREQILQQASSTLLATANQQPAIALTLLQGL